MERYDKQRSGAVVGIYLANPPLESGGASTFERTILQELIKLTSGRQASVFTFSTDSMAKCDSRLLIDGDVEHTIFARTLPPIKRRFSKRLVSHTARRLGFRRPANNLEKSLEDRIQEWAFQRRIDLIYSPSPAMPCRKVPFFVTVWDLQHRKQPFFPEVSLTGWDWETREAHYQSILPRAAGILTGTKVGAAEVMNFYGIDSGRLHVNPLPTPQDALDYGELWNGKPQERQPYERYALYPAQFWPHKNHVVLLKAWKILKENPDFQLKLVFAGGDKGNLDYVKAVTEELQLSADLHFLGFVPREELLSLYHSAEMMIFPTLFGPDNLPPLEAMAIGCPVISSHWEGSDEQLSDAALLTDCTNAEELAGSIRRLLADKDLREKLKVNGKELAIQKNALTYSKKLKCIFDGFVSFRDCWSRTDVYRHP
jgi:glycosyltransferase involved in cell wall biosynthesis